MRKAHERGECSLEGLDACGGAAAAAESGEQVRYPAQVIASARSARSTRRISHRAQSTRRWRCCALVQPPGACSFASLLRASTHEQRECLACVPPHEWPLALQRRVVQRYMLAATFKARSSNSTRTRALTHAWREDSVVHSTLCFGEVRVTCVPPATVAALHPYSRLDDRLRVSRTCPL